MDKMNALTAILDKAKARQAGAGGDGGGELVECPTCAGTGQVTPEVAAAETAEPDGGL